ncbi:MAG: hypothetical protein ACR2JY_23670 [Chloroflexota bacterium]
MLRVGLIGAGGIAANYLGTLDGIAGVQLRAVCDVERSRAVAVAEPRGAATEAAAGGRAVAVPVM